MRILFVSAPLEFPLAVYCLAAQISVTPDLEDCSVQIAHLDVRKLNDYDRKGAEIWRYIALVQNLQPDLVAFSVYLWNNLCVHELVAITGKLFPKAAIVVGGPELGDETAAAEFIEGTSVTAVVRGEGELVMVELVRRLLAGEGPAGVEGCSWQLGNSVVHEPVRIATRDLTRLASPFLSGIVPDDLFDRSPDLQGRFPRALLETYRGCYMECSYCQWGNGTKERHSFSEDRVLGELSWLLERRVSQLFIVDAMFGYKKQQAKALLKHIIEEKRRYQAPTKIVCYHNQDFFDAELFELYREADVSIEIDMQSTAGNVLEYLGRGRWQVESFDRHLAAFRAHRVPTTGSSDLIIGLPRDGFRSFAESVEFLLQRGISVNLEHASVIPSTPMARRVKEDGTLFAPTPPRAVLRNATFTVSEIVEARLLGHGVDFFRRYPLTARIIAEQSSARAVDLCRVIGRLVWDRLGRMYEREFDPAMRNVSDDEFASLVAELCKDDWIKPLLRDLFALEAAITRVRAASPQVERQDVGLPLPPELWLSLRLKYRREAVEEVLVDHAVDVLITGWSPGDHPPPSEALRRTAKTREPRIVLVCAHRNGRAEVSSVELLPTFAFMRRLSGFFSVEQCLQSMEAGRLPAPDIESLRKTIETLMLAGVIVQEVTVV